MNASTQGESIFIHFGIIPSELDNLRCHCGMPLPQDFNYQKYIFVICLYTARELDALKSVQMAYLWIIKSNTLTIQQEENFNCLFESSNHNKNDRGPQPRGFPVTIFCIFLLMLISNCLTASVCVNDKGGNGHSEIAAIGLLINEEEVTRHWFFETFLKKKPISAKTQIFLKKYKMFNYCIDVDNDVVDVSNAIMNAVENTDSENYNSKDNYPDNDVMDVNNGTMDAGCLEHFNYTDIKSIILPGKVRTCGRPKGVTLTTIDLPKKPRTKRT
ncbi:hypothetical protein AGLY_003717 [Aphis glycines]|uniref:Uncharacterized protein n=1 Tax=Aphis glycines TaxID=307491 RepID=A0A6G0TZ02_APHGL|nr:hypothetical protein AGLY_003717 [Aphis glycines]